MSSTATTAPHISPATDAYYAGRNAVDDDGRLGGECQFTDPVLVTAWKRGVRSIRSELRLDADTEWDNDDWDRD